MRNLKFIPIVIILVILCIGLIKHNSLKEINKEDIDLVKYIEYADEVSENKVQVNWKHVASIIGVINDNNFKRVTESEIKKVANTFINKSEEGYELNSLDTVLDSLKFKNREKDRVYNYINDLKYYGLTPNRLNPDTEYMKFINEIKEASINNYRNYKILPSITIAQGILESDWGRSILAKDHNNLFGIKADVYWKGESVTLQTKEYVDTIIDDQFRKYDDKSESIKDHAEFLSKNKRYKDNGVFDSNTYIYQAIALEEAGYSTAVNEQGEKIYADMLINLIQQYNLQLIDSQAQGE